MLNISYIYKNLDEKQVMPLFSATRSGGLANIFAACLVYFLLKDTHQQINAILLTSIIILLSITRIIISERLIQHKNKSGFSVYLVRHFLLTLSIGICWGFYAILQVYQGDESIGNIVFLIQFGLIAGSIATLSVWMPSFLAYMLPQTLAIFTVFISENVEHNLFKAVAFLIFVLMMISTSAGVNRSQKKEHELKQKNKGLIDYLSEEVGQRIHAQEKLEENKRDLEMKVKERTKELVIINKNLQSEIKEKQQAEVNLEYMAYHDELTGLPNKALLIDRISLSIETAQRYETKFGVLFLDLDRFKNINDTLGHLIGDKLILEVSRRLHQTIRKEDTISRNSGDEFVILIQNMASCDEAILVAKKIIKSLTSIFEIDSHKVHIGASIGVSVYPTDGASPLELLRNADTAMYQAKTAGGNRLQFYDHSMSSLLTERLHLENELHTALGKNEFYMVYQPQVDCSNGRTTGFEALLRWNNSNLGNVSPDIFVPILEETGLIYSVGEWVIKQAIQLISSGQVGDLSIAINLSTLQCKDTSLIVLIQHEAERMNIDPSQLEFEITESLLIHDFEKTETFLNELHAIGCTIALDDFGTGYTSMSYLTRLPIDIIKVDKSFIKDINSDVTLFNIVKAIVKMSASLGIKNVFEGVETDAELEVIKNLEGNVIQGFLYSEALRVEDISLWLSSPNKNLKLVITNG